MSSPLSKKKPSASDSPLALTSIEKAITNDSALTLKVQELVESGGSDLAQALVFLRNRDLQAAEDATRKKMLRMGRCPVCTLSLPCKHYREKVDLPAIGEKDLIGNESKTSVIVNITSGDRLEHTSFLPPTVHARLTPSPKRTHGLTARFRSPGGVAYRHKSKERSHSQNETRKVEERRLRLLEKLDKYRETKLRKEIERLEEMRKREEEERRMETYREMKRQQRQQALKQQLADYQERLLKEQEERKRQFLICSQREKLDIKKRQMSHEKQVLPTQKLLINDFHRKAQIIDSIQREQVSDLGDLYSETDALHRVHSEAN